MDFNEVNPALLVEDSLSSEHHDSTTLKNNQATEKEIGFSDIYCKNIDIQSIINKYRNHTNLLVEINPQQLNVITKENIEIVAIVADDRITIFKCSEIFFLNSHYRNFEQLMISISQSYRNFMQN